MEKYSTRCLLTFAAIVCQLSFFSMWPKAFAAGPEPEGHPEERAPLSDGAAAASIRSGNEALSGGAFAEAVSECQTALETTQESSARMRALLCLSEANESLGRYRQAVDAAEAGLASARKIDEPFWVATMANQLGALYRLVGDFEAANGLLTEGIEIAVELENPVLYATVLNNHGNLSVAKEAYEDALYAYDESIGVLADQKSRHAMILRTKIRINAARVTLQRQTGSDPGRWIDPAMADLKEAEDTYPTAQMLISIGQILIEKVRKEPDLVEKDRFAFAGTARTALMRAQHIAERIQHPLLLSFSFGYQGQLYEMAERPEEALNLTRRAVFYAQEANEPKSLYLWQWQTGRLLKKEGDLDDAIDAYRRAAYSIQTIKDDLSLECSSGNHISYRETVGPVYLELADLLLKRSADRSGSERSEKDLIEARSAIEELKIVELQDYFEDECVARYAEDTLPLQHMDLSHVIAIYPVILPQRTELIVSTQNGVRQFTIPISARILSQKILMFRQHLEQPGAVDFMADAHFLYRMLMAPIETDAGLSEMEIETLIFIPDGHLRTIPMAALHDGRQFLAEKYAIVTTPGLTLTTSTRARREGMKLLVSALTESVLGYAPLPYVASELDSLQTLYPCDILKDENFTLPTFDRTLRESNYPVIHIASHGQFNRDHRNTFLLAYNQKITMDDLEHLMGYSRFRREPVQLLTLSACQTALGDDQAALGLAGVAIKAGVRSALATLWFVNDEATSELISRFYRSLKDDTVTKAQALQSAQRALIKSDRFHHPAYWAPFLLIGNWR